jgi:hypothetical protein
MAATVFGTARFGALKELTATGLMVGTLTTTYSADMAVAKNHIGCDASLSLYNDGSEVTCEGVVAVKTTGLVPDLAAAVNLANHGADSLNSNSKSLFTTDASGGSIIVTGATLTRAATEFETGSITGVLKPLISSSGGTVIADAT